MGWPAQHVRSHSQAGECTSSSVPVHWKDPVAVLVSVLAGQLMHDVLPVSAPRFANVLAGQDAPRSSKG